MPAITSGKAAFAALLMLAATTGYSQGQPANTTTVDSKAAMLFAQDAGTYTSEGIYAADWETVTEKNVLWRKRVWRTVDLSDKANSFLAPAALGGHSLAEILVAGLQQDVFKGYSAADERFTNTLTKDMLNGLLLPSDAPALVPSRVTRYQLKEDWLYLADQHKLIVRIIGVAPLIAATGADGQVTERPAFWLYYPYIRKHLAAQQVAGAPAAAGNLDKVFEGRYFAGQINKVSISQGRL